MLGGASRRRPGRWIVVGAGLVLCPIVWGCASAGSTAEGRSADAGELARAAQERETAERAAAEREADELAAARRAAASRAVAEQGARTEELLRAREARRAEQEARIEELVRAQEARRAEQEARIEELIRERSRTLGAERPRSEQEAREMIRRLEEARRELDEETRARVRDQREMLARMQERQAELTRAGAAIDDQALRAQMRALTRQSEEARRAIERGGLDEEMRALRRQLETVTREQREVRERLLREGGVVSTEGGFFIEGPPESWAPDDPGDSLYTAARTALNEGDFAEAARLFGDLVDRFPDSEYVVTASFFEAFARYRLALRAREGREGEEARTEIETAGLALVRASQLARSAEASLAVDIERMRIQIEELRRRVTEIARSLSAVDTTRSESSRSEVDDEGSGNSAEPFVDRIDPLDESLGGPRARADLIFGALESGRLSEEDVAALAMVARGAQDLQLARAALSAIGAEGGEAARSALREIALSADASDGLRRHAIALLAAQGRPTDLRLLVSAVGEMDDPQAAVLAALSTASRYSPRAEDAERWLPLLAEPAVPVELRAALASTLASSLGFDRVRRVYESEVTPSDLRGALAEALVVAGGAEGLEFAEALLLETGGLAEPDRARVRAGLLRRVERGDADALALLRRVGGSFTPI